MTNFQRKWIAEKDPTTPQGFAEIQMLQNKYDLMNSETLWLDDYDEDMIVFVGNSYNTDLIEKNKTGLKAIAHKTFAQFPQIKYFWTGHLLFENA